MGIKSQPVAALPPGTYDAVVIGCEETTRTFDPDRGPEPVVAITAKPTWTSPDGAPVQNVEFVYTPSLNGLSGLSKLLRRFDAHPEDGADWEPNSFVGTQLRLEVTRNAKGFVQVLKDTVRPVE